MRLRCCLFFDDCIGCKYLGIDSGFTLCVWGKAVPTGLLTACFGFHSVIVISIYQWIL